MFTEYDRSYIILLNVYFCKIMSELGLKFGYSFDGEKTTEEDTSKQRVVLKRSSDQTQL